MWLRKVERGASGPRFQMKAGVKAGRFEVEGATAFMSRRHRFQVKALPLSLKGVYIYYRFQVKAGLFSLEGSAAFNTRQIFGSSPFYFAQPHLKSLYNLF